MTPEHPLALHLPDDRWAIRPVVRGDLPALVETCWSDRNPMLVEQFIIRIQKLQQQGRGLGIVALHPATQTAIAYGQVLRLRHAYEISDLIVTPSQRGRGIGKGLIQYLTRTVHGWGGDLLEIGVAADNLSALALYRRLGFHDHRTVLVSGARGKEAILYLRLLLLR